jgi:hypothetical protein
MQSANPFAVLTEDLTCPSFERLVKWWLAADPVHAAEIGRVWLWDEWPGPMGA